MGRGEGGVLEFNTREIEHNHMNKLIMVILDAFC